MPAKKEINATLSSEENAQVQELSSHYQTIANQLQQSTENAQAEDALTAIFAQSESVQLALLKQLARINEPASADVLLAVNTFSTRKEVRKEARRALLRLEGAKVYPQWTPLTTPAVAVQLPTENAPRFWKGFATQTREEGELQLFLCWEQGYDYGEARVLSFLLDYWNDGVKDTFVETGTKRHIEERISQLRTRIASSSHTLASCSLAEGKRLLEEALAVNTWRHTMPSDEYRTQLPIVNKLILQATDLEEATDSSFISPDLETQEVVVNFLGAWSFGDFALAYDLLSHDNALRTGTDRDEWIEQHRAWFDEAHPTRLELGFVHEREQNQQNSGLWLPNAVNASRMNTRKEIEVGWSLELADTPLNGSLKEMPMGSAINKETSRHWFWTSYTLIREQNTWRIQQSRDEALALQGLSVSTLQARIKEFEDEIEKKAQPENRNNETVIEELSWRLNEILHFYDALIAQLPLDYTINEEAYNRSVLTGNPEHMMVYLERLAQRFPQNKADTLRRLGSTMAELAYRYEEQGLTARHNQLIARAEETLHEAIAVDNSAVSHLLMGELLMSLERNEDAQQELNTASELTSTGGDQNLRTSIEVGQGNLAMRQERMNEAIPHYLRVAETNPHYPGLWFSLGFAYRLLGDMEHAEQYYQQGLQEEPGDARLYSELTAIYVNQSQQSKARALLEQGIRINPDSVNLHALLSSLLFEMGDRRGAQRHMNEAERLDPDAEILQGLRQQMATSRKRV